MADNNLLRSYVHKTIDYEYSLKGDVIFAPFHHLSNTWTVSSSSSQNALFDWVDLDYKIAREAIEYNKTKWNKKLHLAISIQEEVLANDSVTKQILNKYSLLDCDWYTVYVDKLSNKTTARILKKYIQFLQHLQNSTGRPVIAWRVGIIGLGLICAWISGFSSWASERDTYYEDLLKKDEDKYGGMSLKYYFPELLYSAIIPNKEDPRSWVVPPPTLYSTIANHLWTCQCYYCKGLDEPSLIKAQNVKLHFLEIINEEVEKIKNIPPEDRKEYFIWRIDSAIDSFEELKVKVWFKPSEYSYLHEWKDAFLNI